jgi:hypothetical protein
MRLYKRTYGLRQICNIAVYIVHSTCTIHLLNLPEKTAKRDIVHGLKHLEEIADDWLCARRTLSILSVLARKWKIELPEEASAVFARTDIKFGHFSTSDVPSPKQELVVATPPSNNPSPPRGQQVQQQSTGLARNPNQLRQSLYSYAPAADVAMTRIQQTAQNTQNKPDTVSSSGTSGIPYDSAIPSAPYIRNRYNNHSVTTSVLAPSADKHPPRNNSGAAPLSTEISETMARQGTPNKLFGVGGADALVESQDWWLRDQASLVLGFDNWMSTGSNEGMGNGSATSPDLTNLPNGTQSLFMSGNGNQGRGDAFADDEWYG